MTIVVFNTFYKLLESLLLQTKCVFKEEIFDPELVVARHKWTFLQTIANSIIGDWGYVHLIGRNRYNDQS